VRVGGGWRRPGREPRYEATGRAKPWGGWLGWLRVVRERPDVGTRLHAARSPGGGRRGWAVSLLLLWGPGDGGGRPVVWPYRPGPASEASTTAVALSLTV